MSKKSAQTAAGALLLFCLNAYVCRELFVTEFTQHMGSIEGAYIALARYVMEHPWGLTWFPWWYGGVPYQNTYPPLLHLLVAAVASTAEISAPLSYHAVTAAAYCLGPVSLFWMGVRLSGRLLPSLAAAVLYSIFSPSAVLTPSVAADMGTVLGPWRLQALVHYGEGPHITSMFLLPVAVVALDFALRKVRPISTLVAAVATMSVVPTNWIGTVALAMAVAAYLLAKGEAGSSRKWVRAAAIGGLSYTLAATWIPPSTLFTVQRNAQIVVGSYEMGAAQWLYLLLVLLVVFAVRYSLRRALVSEFAQFWACFFVLCGSLPLAAEWLDIYILPQPERYHLEMEDGGMFPGGYRSSEGIRSLAYPWKACHHGGGAACWRLPSAAIPKLRCHPCPPNRCHRDRGVSGRNMVGRESSRPAGLPPGIDTFLAERVREQSAIWGGV